MLTGGVVPDTGRVRVLGEDPASFRRSTRERIGYMPQRLMLYEDLTARENVDFVASLFGMLLPRRSKHVPAALKVVDLWEARARRAGDLSGGEQRRLELACALVHGPQLLFLDEPTAGIDPILRTTIWEELHRLRDSGATLVVTTQYVTEAEECDVVALIDRGRLVAAAPPAEIRRRALGGDVVEIETGTPIDPAAVEVLPGVRDVRWTGYRRLRVAVDDAGVASPAIVAALGEAGVEVVRSEEVRPSFDEVFATLVERGRDGATNAGGTPDGAQPGDEPPDDDSRGTESAADDAGPDREVAA
jgi:ABC-2 type transport system ATP-binding protein